MTHSAEKDATREGSEFHEPRLSWTTNKPDAKRTHYMGMHGRISVAMLLDHMATIAPGVKPEHMLLNWATVTWQSDPTPEQVAERVAREAAARARTEEWERKKYAELHAKYADGTRPLPPVEGHAEADQ